MTSKKLEEKQPKQGFFEAMKTDWVERRKSRPDPREYIALGVMFWAINFVIFDDGMVQAVIASIFFALVFWSVDYAIYYYRKRKGTK